MKLTDVTDTGGRFVINKWINHWLCRSIWKCNTAPIYYCHANATPSLLPTWSICIFNSQSDEWFVTESVVGNLMLLLSVLTRRRLFFSAYNKTQLLMDETHFTRLMMNLAWIDWIISPVEWKINGSEGPTNLSAAAWKSNVTELTEHCCWMELKFLQN